MAVLCAKPATTQHFISDTRKRLESSKFPAKIETGNGVVQLVIV